MLYPLSYGGGPRRSLPKPLGIPCFRASRCGYTPAMSTAKKARNTVDRLTGRVKENLGEVTGNPRLRNQGKADQMKARVKMTGERLKDAVRGR